MGLKVGFKMFFLKNIFKKNIFLKKNTLQYHIFLKVNLIKRTFKNPILYLKA